MKAPEKEISGTKIASIVLLLILGILAAIAAPLFANIGYPPLGIAWALVATYCFISVFYDLYKLSNNEKETDNSETTSVPTRDQDQKMELYRRPRATPLES